MGGWGVGQGGVRREEAKAPYRHFGVVVATWCSYKAPIMWRRRSWSNGSTIRS